MLPEKVSAIVQCFRGETNENNSSILTNSEHSAQFDQFAKLLHATETDEDRSLRFYYNRIRLGNMACRLVRTLENSEYIFHDTFLLIITHDNLSKNQSLLSRLYAARIHSELAKQEGAIRQHPGLQDAWRAIQETPISHSIRSALLRDLGKQADTDWDTHNAVLPAYEELWPTNSQSS